MASAWARSGAVEAAAWVMLAVGAPVKAGAACTSYPCTAAAQEHLHCHASPRRRACLPVTSLPQHGFLNISPCKQEAGGHAQHGWLNHAHALPSGPHAGVSTRGEAGCCMVLASCCFLRAAAVLRASCWCWCCSARGPCLSASPAHQPCWLLPPFAGAAAGQAGRRVRHCKCGTTLDFLRAGEAGGLGTRAVPATGRCVLLACRLRRCEQDLR